MDIPTPACLCQRILSILEARSTALRSKSAKSRRMHRKLLEISSFPLSLFFCHFSLNFIHLNGDWYISRAGWGMFSFLIRSFRIPPPPFFLIKKNNRTRRRLFITLVVARRPGQRRYLSSSTHLCSLYRPQFRDFSLWMGKQ